MARGVATTKQGLLVHALMIRVTLAAGRGSSEQFLDLAMAEIDDREGSAGRAWQVGLEVEAEAVEDGRGDVGRLDRPVRRHRADRVAGADDPAPLDPAAGEADGEALRPVVAPPGGVHPRGPPELGQVADQGR